MALTIKDLISSMEALASPDAEVFFIDGTGDIFPVNGGILDSDPDTGQQGMLLTTQAIVAEAAF